MAMMDNRRFLVTHIRNSFITSDDTGMCELIIDVDEADGSSPETFITTNGVSKKTDENNLRNESKQDVAENEILIDVELAHSMDILPDMDFAGHRRRSNTAQRLDKLKREKQKQSKIKHIQWKDGNTAGMGDYGEQFMKKDIIDKQIKKKSRLSQLLDLSGKSDNPFTEYAKFNGKSSVGIPTKKIGIFLTMAQGSDRDFPMMVITIPSATIAQLIGMICWQYTEEGRKPPLRQNAASYALYIAEDDGEVDSDFPALDNREPISKFGFAKLALVEKDVPVELSHDISSLVKVHMAGRAKIEICVDSTAIPMKNILEECLLRREIKKHLGPRYFLEKEKNPGVAIDLEQTLQAMNTLEFRMIREHSTRDIEEDLPLAQSTKDDMLLWNSHNYQSYVVQQHHRMRTSIEVQLGISGEKIEIDPVAKGKLFTKHKPESHSMEIVANCSIIEEKPSGKAIFRLVYQGSSDYRHRDFECEKSKAQEITQKISNILEIRSSLVRKEYMANRSKRPYKRRYLPT